MPAIVCEAPRAVDGDTLRCVNLAQRIRLAGIDAPELPGHCRQGRACVPGDPLASRQSLATMLQSAPVSILPQGFDRYGRIIATVKFGRLDASCAQVARGHAVFRYGRIAC